MAMPVSRSVSATAVLWERSGIWRWSVIFGSVSAALYLAVVPAPEHGWMSLGSRADAPPGAGVPDAGYVSPISPAIRSALNERANEAIAAREAAAAAQAAAAALRAEKQKAEAEAAALRAEKLKAEADATAAREQTRQAQIQAQAQAQAAQAAAANAAREAALARAATSTPVANAPALPAAGNTQQGLVAPNAALPPAAEAERRPTGIDEMKTSPTGAGEVVVGGRRIPLPSGNFEPMGYAFSRYGTTTWSRVALTLIENNRLVAIVLVLSTPFAKPTDAGLRRFSDCDRSDMHYKNFVANDEFGKQECNYVNHIWPTAWRSDDTSDALKMMVVTLDARGVPIPNAMIASTFHYADAKSFLRVVYYFNPEVQGIDSAKTNSWAESDWSKKYLARDVKKVNYLGEMEQWSRAWLPFMRPSFEGGAGATPAPRLATKFVKRG